MKSGLTVEIISKAIQMEASDIHIIASYPPVYRRNGRLITLPEDRVLSPQDTRCLGEEMISDPGLKQDLEKFGQIDFARSFPGLGRVRINLYIQSGSWAAAVRIIPLEVPALDSLGLPPVISDLAMKEQGLFLITGATGSGKSTTLAGIIDYVNHSRRKNIITLEDPVEFIHQHGTCIINQREVGRDTSSFTLGLRAALRQDPDIIMIGEMRDLDTIAIAVTAAETGHLVIASLHSGNVVQSLQRVIDVFPPYQQPQIRLQLSTSLLGIISQQLIPSLDGKSRIAAAEILIMNPAIRNLIRENKMHQINSAIEMGGSTGMTSMNKAVKTLYQQNQISFESFSQYGKN